MFRVRSEKARGFTLLEVVIAVAIIALMAMTIYRFIETNLSAIRISTEQTSEAAAMQAQTSQRREVGTRGDYRRRNKRGRGR